MPSEIQYIDISSVSCRRINAVRPLDMHQAPSRARRGVRSGDTLISTVRPERRSLAYVHDADASLVASTGFAVLTPREISPALLYALATSHSATAHYVAEATGSAYPAVSPAAIGALRIPVPADRGAAFATMVGPALAHQASLLAETNTLTAIRDALLPKLVSGKIRVPLSDDPAEGVGVAMTALDATAC